MIRHEKENSGDPASWKTLVVVSGLAGSGKTTVIHELEDLGYYCVDNLPAALLVSFVELLEQGRLASENIALALDSRDPEIPKTFQSLYERLLRTRKVTILYLKASSEVVLKRFCETRRQHPMTAHARLLNLNEAIALDIQTLEPIEKLANQAFDTSHMPAHRLKKLIRSLFSLSQEANHLLLNFVSFGFKFGVPTDLDTLFDVRFLQNPYYDPKLRKLTGKDARVQDYVYSDPNTSLFLQKVIDLVKFLYPLYVEEGKHYFSVGIGCTGGQHRSVALVEHLASVFCQTYPFVTREHRHIE